MESHEVFRELLKHSSAKAIAADLGVSLSLVYKWSEEPSSEGAGSGSRNPLDRIAGIIETTQSLAVLQWLCQRAGGYFVHNPAALSCGEEAVMPATNEIVQQFADLLNEISAAAADNDIDEKEATRIRQVWELLKSYGEGFVRACEEGDFSRIREAEAGRQAS
ncbi:MAG: hypothetical protein AAF555_01085 [Verrucomicrobiota bacterium]